MASETKTKEDKKAMAADTTALVPGGADEPREPRSAPDRAAAPAKANFFTIYKKGQGKATRFGTAAGAALLGALFVWHIYRYVPAFISHNDPARGARIG